MAKVERCPACNHMLIQRSSEQNSKLHATLQDISQQKKWAGEYRDIETWKRGFVSAFERHQGRAPLMLPALDGHGMDFIFSRTSRMTKEELSELLEFVVSWALDNDVLLRDNIPMEAA